MVRPISRSQFSDLWFAEFQSATGRCILCGNDGRIDTRGKVWDPRGDPCGGEAFCICPNGRHLKRAYEDAVRKGGGA